MRTFGTLAIAAILLSGCIFSEYDEEGRLRNISPAAMAALPRGMDPAFLVRDDAGCYFLVVAEGGAGIPLRNAAGAQVCDG